MPPTVKDVKISLGKVQIYLEELSSSIEERERLISVLKLTPSSNDNYDLISLLQKLSKYLRYLQDDLEVLVRRDRSIIDEHIGQFRVLALKYNELVEQVSKEATIDVEEYKFNLNLTLGANSIPKSVKDTTGSKSVRFKDDIDEDNDILRNELMGTRAFKPYSDNDNNSTDIDSEAESFDAQSNQQMFAQHQQTLNEQDSDLDLLHQSIRRQHSMGMTINEELDDQLIILNDLESGIDRAQSRLSSATRRLNEFRKTCKENGSLVTIIVLTVILVLLLVVLN
ncbi:uncharacterized protein RJT21DRAFT_121487 [Scheffersomyces amazonensis]|uniref:uncharacterized protein n=1 Tax=Scheffersomyces amazonensis TaxID=1078765 RepID=UPI00315DC053